jgi:hypothetical protein
MSAKFSYDHEEQEPHRSAASTEADFNPVVQRSNEGERLPADVPSEREALSSNQEQAILRASALNDAGIAAWQQYR